MILFGQLVEQPAGAAKKLIVYQAKTQAILIGGVVQLKTGLDRQFLSDEPGPGRIGRPLVPLCKAQNNAGGQQFTHQGIVASKSASEAKEIGFSLIAQGQRQENVGETTVLSAVVGHEISCDPATDFKALCLAGKIGRR